MTQAEREDVLREFNAELESERSKKHEGWGWLNKYSQVYNTKEEALSHKPEFNKVFLVKVEWEE